MSNGDEIKIRIAETDRVDEPREAELNDTAKEVQQKKDYVRAMAKQLGWKIQTNAEGMNQRSRGKK